MTIHETLIENELLNIKNLVALIMADVDIFLLQDETQAKDKNKLYDKYEIREQLHQSGKKILNILSDCGYDISTPLQRYSNINFNQ